MKKGLFILMFIVTATASAQSSFGVKAGLNYGDNGEIEFSDFSSTGEDVSKGADSKVGYHLGIYYRSEMGGLYLKPELLYTRTKSSYDYNNENADYNISKLDLPVMLGVKIIGPVHVFAGPSFQYILDNEFDGVSVGDVENEFTIGAQFGAGLQIGRISLDVRYERGLSENEAQVLDLNNPNGLKRVDSRPNQFILAVSLDL